MAENAKVLVVSDRGTQSQVRALLPGLREAGFELLGTESVTEESGADLPRDPVSDLEVQVGEADLALVVVGENTFRSSWVEREIRGCKEAGLPICAVKTRRTNVPPQILYGVDAIWSPEFSAAAVLQTLRSAIETRSV